MMESGIKVKDGNGFETVELENNFKFKGFYHIFALSLLILFFTIDIMKLVPLENTQS